MVLIKKKHHLGDIVYYGIVYALTAFAFVVTLYPFIYILAVSLSGSQAVYQGKVFLFPVDFTISGYQQVFKQEGLWTAYGNTLFYTIFGTLFNLVATALAAYPLARKDFFARKQLNFFISFTMYFGGGMIPVYLLLTSMGFYNSRWVMIIPSLLSTYNVMVCRSAYSAIPEELMESAKIDGANEFGLFFYVAVRLITPTLAVLTLYYAVAHWNDFMTPLLYMSDNSLVPVQTILRRVLVQSSSEFMDGTVSADDKAAVSIQIRYVTIIVATLPILAIYPLLQKYFVKGVMLGAVKG